MGMSKLARKLEDFLDLSKKRQVKKRDKLAKFIDKLDKKKNKLEKAMAAESEHDETSNTYKALRQEFKAVSKLLKRAKKNEHALAEKVNH
jgi:acyl-coenzyme A synthetase/AMP-(fatty) acid ligase